MISSGRTHAPLYIHRVVRCHTWDSSRLSRPLIETLPTWRSGRSYRSSYDVSTSLPRHVGDGRLRGTALPLMWSLQNAHYRGSQCLSTSGRRHARARLTAGLRRGYPVAYKHDPSSESPATAPLSGKRDSLARFRQVVTMP